MLDHFILASTSDDAINKTVEHYVLLSLSIGQKWGVLATVMAALMLWGFSQIYKVRKNVKMKQTFNFWSIGMVVLAVIFTIAPYFVMHFMEQQ